MSRTKASKFFDSLFHGLRIRTERIKKFETAYRKFCRGCSTTKEISEFYKSDYHSGGYRPRCKTCVIKYSTERKQKMRKEGTKDTTINDRLEKELETLRTENAKQKESIQLLADEVKEKALELGLTEISRNGLKERLESCEIALEDRDNKIETLKALHIDDLRDLDREIKGLEVENNELRKKRSKGQINEAYAELIEKQDIERQKQALKINQLRQKNKSLLAGR